MLIFFLTVEDRIEISSINTNAFMQSDNNNEFYYVAIGRK